MSEPSRENGSHELPRSSVKLVRNVKGETQLEVKVYVRAWRRRNPQRCHEFVTRQRARKANAAGANYCTAEKIAARRAFYGDRCVYCGTQATTIDHVIPLSRGGSHFPSNIVPACQRCNSSKGAKTSMEWQGAV